MVDTDGTTKDALNELFLFGWTEFKIHKLKVWNLMSWIRRLEFEDDPMRIQRIRQPGPD